MNPPDAPSNRQSITRRSALGLLSSLPLLGLLSTPALAGKPLKIGFVGAGRMAQALGTLLVHAGHEVTFSSRHPEEIQQFVAGLGPHAHAGSVDQAVKFGDVLFLTIPYSGIPNLTGQYGKALEAKRLVVDVGNANPQRDGDIGKDAQEQGAGPYLQHIIPHARIVRAFNAINFAKVPEYAARPQKVAAPILGEDLKAIALAEQLIREIGFEPVLVGGLKWSALTAPKGPLSGEHTPEEVRKIAAAEQSK